MLRKTQATGWGTPAAVIEAQKALFLNAPTSAYVSRLLYEAVKAVRRRPKPSKLLHLRHHDTWKQKLDGLSSCTLKFTFHGPGPLAIAAIAAQRRRT
eukprot:CAMPEP_0180441880 /NCGR_PEP_ID=MMETSP1036_2-20121128/13854_1 /TAXON_ID=632150 /ORGANISM="Azadinium spinosum, Strain 3D9" /LENGTH=96 /DNA_ID=CAMNT_0022448109 /DNA_START=371 /DNA_END=662 /DNA_ORIENTATION=+